jgi:hypothetical protein
MRTASLQVIALEQYGIDNDNFATTIIIIITITITITMITTTTTTNIVNTIITITGYRTGAVWDRH